MLKPGKIVAVMQPYFLPYPGYFRLLAGADCFVILDCVQFNRRGRVHRVQIPGPGGSTEWLTLPLARQPRDVLVRDLAFAADARLVFDGRLARHRELLRGSGAGAARLREYLGGPLESVGEFLESGIRMVADLLELQPRILRSSQLAIAPDLRAQDRIIAIVQALYGSGYLNAPGGRHLYDRRVFEQAGLGLSLLVPYEGRFPFLMPALMTSEPAAVRADILRYLQVTPA